MNNLDIITHYWKMESEFNLPQVLQCFSDEAVFMSPGNFFKGKEQIRLFYEEMMKNNCVIDTQITFSLEQNEFIAAEYNCRLVRKDGIKRCAKGFNLFRIQDGKICMLHAYFNPADF